MGGIEYNDRGNKEKTKNKKVSHQLGKSMDYGDVHQLILM
jgi:hypothetical protein